MLVVIVLCQVVISNDTIHPQAVCPLGDNSLDELKEIKGNSFSSIASLGFILVIWVSVSLSQSTNPYKCLTQVDNIFFRIVQLLCILDLNPSYTKLFRTHTLYQGGAGGGGVIWTYPTISSTLGCTNVKFCKVLEIPFKISENTRFVKNLLYGYHGNCLITWCFLLIIVKMIMKNR